MAARELCERHAVVMALQGLELPHADSERRVLWVQAGSTWGTLLPLGDSGLWRVDAGCPLSVMRAAKLADDTTTDDMQTLAQWFAQRDRFVPLHRSNLTARLVSVDWLFADGTIEVFGAFGAADDQPLNSLKAQQVVPRLFELAADKQVQGARDACVWPMRFHLDALLDQQAVNLAHFFVGHGGSLGWLVAATFRQAPDTATTADPDAGVLDHVWGTDLEDFAALDLLVKQSIDPTGVFLSLPD